MTIKEVIPIYTGGGIYIIVGKADNKYFMFDTDYEFVGFYKTCPYDLEVSCYRDWQKENEIETLIGIEAIKFQQEALKWVVENEPENEYTNYAMSEIISRIVEEE